MALKKRSYIFDIDRVKLSLEFSKQMLSISRNVHMFVCVSVCSLLRYRLNVFLPQLPQVGCPIFLEIRNPWGKVMEKSFFCWLILPYKTWWKTRFPMD